MIKNKQWQSPIPKTPKFNQRRMFYFWEEIRDGYYFYNQGWLTHSEVTLLILQGSTPQLVKSQ